MADEEAGGIAGADVGIVFGASVGAVDAAFAHIEGLEKRLQQNPLAVRFTADPKEARAEVEAFKKEVKSGRAGVVDVHAKLSLTASAAAEFRREVKATFKAAPVSINATLGSISLSAGALEGLQTKLLSKTFFIKVKPMVETGSGGVGGAMAAVPNNIGMGPTNNRMLQEIQELHAARAAMGAGPTPTMMLQNAPSGFGAWSRQQAQLAQQAAAVAAGQNALADASARQARENARKRALQNLALRQEEEAAMRAAGNGSLVAQSGTSLSPIVTPVEQHKAARRAEAAALRESQRAAAFSQATAANAARFAAEDAAANAARGTIPPPLIPGGQSLPPRRPGFVPAGDDVIEARRADLRRAVAQGLPVTPLQHSIVAPGPAAASRLPWGDPAARGGRFAAPGAAATVAAKAAQMDTHLATQNFKSAFGKHITGAMSTFGNTLGANTARRIQDLQAEARRNFFAGQTLLRNFTLPAALGVGLAAYQGAKFEGAMTKTAALTDTPRAQIPGLSQQVIGLSRELPQSATKLAEGLYEVASAGFKGQAGFKVMESAAKGAAAGLGDTKVVANTLTSVIAAYGQSAGDAAKNTDILTKMVILGKGEASEYAGAIGKVIPMAGILGVSFEELSANLATMSRLGISPDVGATALNQLLTHLAAPTPQGNDALKAMGYTPQSMRKAIGPDGPGLMGVLKDVFDKSGGDISVIEQLLGNVRGLKAALATTGTQAQTYKEILSSIGQSHGTTDKALKEMADTAEFQWGRMLNAGNAVLLSVSGKVLPGITKSMENVADGLPSFTAKVSRAWEELDKGTPFGLGQKAALGAAGFLALSGPLFTASALGKDAKAAALSGVNKLGGGPIGVAKAAMGPALALQVLMSDQKTLGDKITDVFWDWSTPLQGVLSIMNSMMLVSIALRAGNSLVGFTGSAVGAARTAVSGVRSVGTAAATGIAASGGVIPFARNVFRPSYGAGLIGPAAASGAASGAGMLAGAAPAVAGVAAVGLGMMAAYTYAQNYSNMMGEVDIRQKNIEISAKAVARAFEGLGSVMERNAQPEAGENSLNERLSKAMTDFAAAGDNSEAVRASKNAINKIKADIKLGVIPLDAIDAQIVTNNINDLIKNKIEPHLANIDIKVKSPIEQIAEDISAPGTLGGGIESLWNEASRNAKDGNANMKKNVGAIVGAAKSGIDWIRGEHEAPATPANPFFVKMYADANKRQAALKNVPNLLHGPKNVLEGTAEKQLQGLLNIQIPNGKDLSKVIASFSNKKALDSAIDRLLKDPKLRAKFDDKTMIQLKERQRSLASTSGTVGNGVAEVSPQQIAQKQAVAKQMEAEKEELGKLVSAYQSYSSVLDGLLGKVREFADQSERARVSNEMHKKAMDGVDQSYKNQAISLATLYDRMKRVSEARQEGREFYGGLQQMLTARGISPDIVRPFAMKSDQLGGNYSRTMRGIQGEALNLGADLSLKAASEIDSNTQAINDLTANIQALNDSLSRQAQNPATAAVADRNGVGMTTPIGISNGADVARSMVGMSGRDSQVARSMGKAYGQEWCVGFAQIVAEKSGQGKLANGALNVDGVRSWAKKNSKAYVGTPRIGDFATMKNVGKTRSHIGVVSAVNADGTFSTIGGNEGSKNNYASKVVEGAKYPINHRGVLFVRNGSVAGNAPKNRSGHDSSAGGNVTAEERAAISRLAGTDGQTAYASQRGRVFVSKPSAKSKHEQSRVDTKVDRFTGFKDSLTPYNNNWIEKYFGKMQRPTQWNPAMFSLQQKLQDGSLQDKLLQGAGARGLKGAALEKYLAQEIANRKAAARKVDLAVKGDSASLAYSEMQGGWQRRRALMGRENDPIAALRADFNDPTKAASAFNATQRKDALKNELGLLKEAEQLRTRQTTRESDASNKALAKGDEYLKSLKPGEKVDMERYNQVIAAERTRLGIWRELDAMFRNDPSKGKIDTRKEANRRYYSQIESENASIASETRSKLTDSDWTRRNELNLGKEKLGYVRSGMNDRSIEARLAGQRAYDERLEQERRANLAAARKKAAKLNKGEGSEVYGEGFVKWEAAKGDRSAIKAAMAAKDEENASLKTQWETEDEGAYRKAIEDISNGFLTLADSAGVAQKAIELFGASSGNTLSPGKKLEILQGINANVKKKADYDFGMEKSSIGTRNEAERVAAERAFFESQLAAQEAEARKAQGANFKPEAHAEIVKGQRQQFDIRAQQATLEAPRLGEELMRQDEARLRQMQLESFAQIAITDEQKAQLIVQEKLNQYADRRLAVTKEQADAFKVQAEAQVKAEKENAAIAKEKAKIEDLRQMSLDATRKMVDGGSIGGFGKDILGGLGKQARELAATTINDRIWKQAGGQIGGIFAPKTKKKNAAFDLLGQIAGINGNIGLDAGMAAAGGGTTMQAGSVMLQTAGTVVQSASVNVSGNVVNVGQGGAGGLVTGTTPMSSGQRDASILSSLVKIM